MDLKKHSETHNQIHIKCEECSYIAIHIHDLRRHINTMHTICESAEVFGCHKCEFSTQHENVLNEHVKNTHTKQSRYFYASSRKAHNGKSHSKENLHATSQSSSQILLHCNKCNFTTKFADELKRHTEIHTDKSNSRRESNRPKFKGDSGKTKPADFLFECKKCDEGFYHKDEHELHIQYFHENIENEKPQQE